MKNIKEWKERNMKNKLIKIGIVFGLLILLTGFPSISSVVAISQSETDVILENSSVRLTDISFGVVKIIATVENKGNVDADVTVIFSISKGAILPYIIGSYDVTIPAGETVKVLQRFTGLGLYKFYVRIDDVGFLMTKGFWFFFFGWEID